MIYKTFKEWAAGLWLEDGEPRKQAYTRDELLFIEMGWNYGKEAGVAAEREACAKVCDAIAISARKKYKETYNPYEDGRADGALECEEAIRARGNK